MKVQKWNDNWLFWKNLNSFALDPSVPAHAVQVDLPHDAMLLETPYADSRNKGNTGYRDGGVYSYQKTLHIAPEDTGRTFYLKLEGVYMNALVYVNGALAAQQPYGYTGFCVPLHDFLNAGCDNEIRVEARNSGMTNSRWYSGSGVYRDVYLLSAGEVYLRPDALQAETKDVSESCAHVQIRAQVHNRGLVRRRMRAALTVLDAEGNPAAQTELLLTAFPGETVQLREQLTIPQPKLWDDLEPNLYAVRCTLCTENGEVLDDSETSFGIRTLTLDAQSGLRVNGRTVQLRGACLHHDNGLLGAATYEEAEYRRVKKLREAGFNAIRMSHHPMSPAMLRACDHLGVYVMDEAFDMWTRCKGDCDYALSFADWWERDVTAMVEKDYNHPCVVLYSLGNEIPEIGTEQGVRVLRALSEKVKALDATRYTTVAINGVFTITDKMGQIVGGILRDMPEERRGMLGLDSNVNVFMTVLDNYMDQIVTDSAVADNLTLAAPAVDVVGYNYMTARYTVDRDEAPNRVIVGSETYPGEIGRNWETMKECPNVIGDFTWTGWDYIGEAGVGVPAYAPGEGGFDALFPCQLAYCGDIDLTGFRRPASYYREIVFGLRKAPYITVQDPAHYGQRLMKTNWIISDSVSSWTYPGMEGKPAVVEIYCGAPEVELVQDGVSLGRKPAGPQHNFTALFETEYRPGTLIAIAWDGECELGRMKLSTVGEATSVRVTEEADVRDFGSHLHFYEIELTDENGSVNAAADCEIAIEVENGKLLGFGSGDPKPLHTALETVTRTWNGRAQAIVQAEGTPRVMVRRVRPE